MELTLNLSIFEKFPYLYKLLAKQFGYVADRFYQFDLATSSLIEAEHASKLLVVSRQYYSETLETYSAISKKELESILKLKSDSHEQFPDVVVVLPNIQVDGFDVKRIHFHPKLLERLPVNTVLLPETELLVEKNGQLSVSQFETPSGLLFAANTHGHVTSAYQKGVIRTIETFLLSVGLPNHLNVAVIDEKQFAGKLFQCLVSQKIDSIVSRCSYRVSSFVSIDKLHLLYWAPIATASMVILAMNGYYKFQNYSIEQQLEQHGETVNELLAKKNEQDTNSAFISLINEQLKGANLVHNDWEVVYQAANLGMFIQQFRKRDNIITMRGRAKDASEILKALNELERVTSAAFQGVVRKSRGEDSFVITLEVAGNNK